MFEIVNEKIEKEIKKILSKDELTSDEIQMLIMYKNDLKMEDKMKKMIEFTM